MRSLVHSSLHSFPKDPSTGVSPNLIDNSIIDVINNPFHDVIRRHHPTRNLNIDFELSVNNSLNGNHISVPSGTRDDLLPSKTQAANQYEPLFQ